MKPIGASEYSLQYHEWKNYCEIVECNAHDWRPEDGFVNANVTLRRKDTGRELYIGHGAFLDPDGSLVEFYGPGEWFGVGGDAPEMVEVNRGAGIGKEWPGWIAGAADHAVKKLISDKAEEAYKRARMRGE